MLLWSLIILPVILFNVSGAKHLSFGDNSSVNKDLDLDPHIVGGEDATIEELPYQVALLEGEMFICGGSIINPNAILTAAHCVSQYTNDNRSISIRAGSSYKDKDGQVVKVLRISVHPKYNSQTSDYDVAVLLLEKNLPLGPTIKPIELQPANEVVPDGTTGVISGWGTRKSGENQLQKAEVPKTNFDLCKKAYQDAEVEVTVRMTCYGLKEGGKDSCQGDSGGPLVVNGKQVGVISWGAGCALAEFPGVYADIANEEIQEHILNSSV